MRLAKAAGAQMAAAKKGTIKPKKKTNTQRFKIYPLTSGAHASASGEREQ